MLTASLMPLVAAVVLRTGGDASVVFSLDASHRALRRGACAPAELNPTPARCRIGASHLPLIGIQPWLESRVAIDAEDLDQRLLAARERLASIELRLLEIASSDNPSADQPALRAELARIERQLVDVHLRREAAAEQVRRLELAFNAGGDPDDSAQLQLARARLEQLTSERDALAAELHTVREQLLEVLVVEDQTAEYQALLRNQRTTLQAVLALREARADALAVRQALRQLLVILGNDELTLDLSDGDDRLGRVAAAMAQEFAAVRQSGVFQSSRRVDDAIELIVPRNGALVHFTCGYTYLNPSHCHGVVVNGPAGFQEWIPATELHLDPQEPTAPALIPLLTAPLAGRWRIEPRCDDPTATDREPFTCTLQYAAPR